MTPEQRASDAIGSRILSGLAWKAGSQITLQITRMVVALVLARHADAARLGPRGDGARVLGLRRRLHGQRAGHGADPAARAAATATARPSSGSAPASASLLALVGRRARRPAGRASTASRDVRWLFVALSRRLPRQRARHDADGAARSRDGVPTARAAADRGHARRRGVGIGIAVADYGAWAIVGQLLGRGGRSRRCSSGC